MRQGSLLARAATTALVAGCLAVGTTAAAQQNKPNPAPKPGAPPAAVHKSTSGAKPTSGHPATYYKISQDDEWAGVKQVHKPAPNPTSKPK